jgi:hypothetical protein
VPLVVLIRIGAENDGVAEVVFHAAQVTMAGGKLLRWMSGRFWPAVLGFFAGSVLAFGSVWGVSQTESARLTYARARPERALAADFIKVAPVLDKYKIVHKKPPETMAQLIGALRQDGYSPRFSIMREDVWVDAWGTPLRYRSKRLIGWSTELYSVGPDGVDTEGAGDDLSAAGTFAKWKLDQFLTSPPKDKDEKK